MTKGWAVINNGEPNIKTVGESERAAMVNGLVVICGVKVNRHHSNADIQNLWLDYSSARLTVRPVNVTVATPT